MKDLAENKTKKLKPRALILMANNKDFEKILDFIKTLNEVQLVYLTNKNLRVVKEPMTNASPLNKHSSPLTWKIKVLSLKHL